MGHRMVDHLLFFIIQGAKKMYFSGTFVVFAVLAVGIGLITFFFYYTYKEKTLTEDANQNSNFCYYAFKYKDKEKNLAYDEDANPNSKKSRKSTGYKGSQESTEFEDEGSSENYTNTEFSENESSENYTDTDTDTEIQAEEYSECSMDQVHPYPFHGFGFNIRCINGVFRTWIVAKVHRIGMINKDSKRQIVWARVHFYCPNPMPAPLIVECRLSDQLRHQPISIGNFVVVEYNAYEEFSSKRDYYIIKINYSYQ